MIHKSFCILVCLCSLTLADGLRDNDPSDVRKVPPPGIDVPPKVANELREGLAELSKALDGVKKSIAPELIADVEIFHRAVLTVLEHNELELKAHCGSD